MRTLGGSTLFVDFSAAVVVFLIRVEAGSSFTEREVVRLPCHRFPSIGNSNNGVNWPSGWSYIALSVCPMDVIVEDDSQPEWSKPDLNHLQVVWTSRGIKWNGYYCRKTKERKSTFGRPISFICNLKGSFCELGLAHPNYVVDSGLRSSKRIYLSWQTIWSNLNLV